MKAFITTLLSIQLALVPSFQAQAQVVRSQPIIEKNVMLKLIRDEVQKSPQYYDPNGQRDFSVEKAMSLEEMGKLVKKLKDNTQSFESIKNEIRSRMHEEEGLKLIELKHVIKKMSPEALNQIFEETMKRSPITSSDDKMAYQAAYTADEKRQVVLEMAQKELSLAKSISMKQLGLLDREALAKELEKESEFINTKGKWTTFLVIALSIAAAGLVSWAIVSSTQKKWEKKTKAEEDRLEKENEKLIKEFETKEAEISAVFNERRRLRDEGYVWTICSTTERVKSVSCSYDFRSHSGVEQCITRCLKNPSTGDSTQHVQSCSSAFIPSNCFSMNPYNNGFEDGYNSGYDEGYNSSYHKYYEQAYHEYYDRGYDEAYIRGYDRGYDEGYDDGYYNRGWGPSGTFSTTDMVSQGFSKGYTEGYAAAQQQLTGF